MYTIKENFLSSVFKSLVFFCSIQMLNPFGSKVESQKQCHLLRPFVSCYRFPPVITTDYKIRGKLQLDTLERRVVWRQVAKLYIQCHMFCMALRFPWR